MYPAGSYNYYTTEAPATPGGVGTRATASPVEVPYAAGLGMAVPATTGVADSQGIGTLQNGNDGYLTINNSTNLNDNTTIKVPTSTQALTGETITISGTRPQSVWYTVGQEAPAATQAETNNIYAPTAGKLVGSVNNVNGSGAAATGGTNNGTGGTN